MIYGSLVSLTLLRCHIPESRPFLNRDSFGPKAPNVYWMPVYDWPTWKINPFYD